MKGGGKRVRGNPLVVFGKVCVSAVLLVFVVRKAGADNVLRHLRSMEPAFFILSALLYLVIAWIVALRWRMLLDNRYSAARLFSLHMIGSFFNNLLPGAIGGDAVRVFYLYRDTGNSGLSFGSVFLDRFLGLAARLTVGFVSGLLAWQELKSVGLHLAVPAFFISVLAAGMVLFRIRIGRRFSGVARFYDYVLDRIGRTGLMIRGFLLSLLIQALLILMVFCIARGMGQELNFIALFVFVPIIITLFIIPATLSGLGVREGAFVVLFGLIDIPASVSVSISFLWFLSMAAASLIGLVEYVRYKKQPGFGIPQDLKAAVFPLKSD